MRRRVVRRRVNESGKLLAAVSGRQPIRDITALGDVRPVQFQIEPADALERDLD
jgi:hypothetical protein